MISECENVRLDVVIQELRYRGYREMDYQEFKDSLLLFIDELKPDYPQDLFLGVKTALWISGCGKVRKCEPIKFLFVLPFGVVLDGVTTPFLAPTALKRRAMFKEMVIKNIEGLLNNSEYSIIDLGHKNIEWRTKPGYHQNFRYLIMLDFYQK